MLAGKLTSLRVDLNGLRGNRLVTSRAFTVDEGGRIPTLSKDEIIRVVEEEGDAYLATVVDVDPDGLLVELRLHLETLTPQIDLHGGLEFAYGVTQYTPSGSLKV